MSEAKMVVMHEGKSIAIVWESNEKQVIVPNGEIKLNLNHPIEIVDTNDTRRECINLLDIITERVNKICSNGETVKTVINRLSKEYKGLSKEEKLKFAEKFAGKRQMNEFVLMLDNLTPNNKSVKISSDNDKLYITQDELDGLHVSFESVKHEFEKNKVSKNEVLGILKRHKESVDEFIDHMEKVDGGI